MDSLISIKEFKMRFMKPKFFVGLAALLLFSKIGLAATLNVPLDSTSYADLDLTTGVWNIASQELHPKLQIENWNFSAGVGAAIEINVGDGSDGPFNISTYANFGTVSGTTIYLTTRATPFNFTSFELAANYIIEPVGSYPLIIRSQSDVILQNSAGIRCSGMDGENSKQSFVAGSTVSLGGNGRCGGGNGGSGYQTFNASMADGADGGTGISGGGGAPDSTNAANGGGGGGAGGSVESSEYRGQNGTSVHTQAGQDTLNTLIGTELWDYNLHLHLDKGGSGGGAGGAYTPFDGKEATGGGGGGGGGVVVIHAVDDVRLATSSSFITSSGGYGGDSGDGNNWGGAGSGLGGGGGGGAGGKVWIAAGGELTNNASTGFESDIDAFEGNGGNDPVSTPARLGGNATRGSVWLTDSTCDGPTAPNTGCPITSATPNNAVKYGQVLYNTTTDSHFYSKAIDLNNTNPNLESILVTTSNSGNGTLTTWVQASDDAAFTSPTAEIDGSSISTISGHRFLRVHLVLDNNNSTTPIKVTGITINYTPQNTTKFEFVSACGRIDTTWLLILVGMFLIMVPSNLMRPRLKS